MSCMASLAAGSPATLSAAVTSARSLRWTQRTTSPMERSEVAAASISAASRVAAALRRKSASGALCPAPLPASTSERAEASSPVTAAGSYRYTSPFCHRWLMVWRIRSDFVHATSTGPSHSSTAGTARPLVFWLWAGPSAMIDWSGSAATRRALMRPITTRPARGRGVLHHHGARQPAAQGAERLRQVDVGRGEDQQRDRHHHVEGDRPGQHRATRRRPGGRWVAHGAEEPRHDHAHVADRHPRPGPAGVQEAGDLAGEPEQEGRTEPDRHRDEQHLLDVALALDRRLAAHWTSPVTRLPRPPRRAEAAPPTAPSEGPCWRRCRRSPARSSSRCGAGR